MIFMEEGRLYPSKKKKKQLSKKYERISYGVRCSVSERAV